MNACACANDHAAGQSALGNGSFPHFDAFKFSENMIAMILFGLIIAFFARRIQKLSS